MNEKQTFYIDITTFVSTGKHFKGVHLVADAYAPLLHLCITLFV